MMSKFQENIKHLIPRPKTPVVKQPMYRSIYTESVRRTYKSNNNCHKTMGYAEVELYPPSEFLKKHSRKEMRPFVGKSYTNSAIVGTNIIIRVVTLMHFHIIF